MKSGLFVLLALGFTVLAESPLMAQPPGPRRGDQEAAKNGWLFNLEEGFSQAEKSGKPLMVVFRCLP